MTSSRARPREVAADAFRIIASSPDSRLSRFPEPLVYRRQDEKMNVRKEDKTITPTAFLWAAYLPSCYYYEVPGAWKLDLLIERSTRVGSGVSVPTQKQQ